MFAIDLLGLLGHALEKLLDGSSKFNWNMDLAFGVGCVGTGGHIWDKRSEQSRINASGNRKAYSSNCGMAPPAIDGEELTVAGELLNEDCENRLSTGLR
jgi:hypothetical protein